MDRRCLLLAMTALLASPARAIASGDDDDDDREEADRALRERAAGRFRPLSEIMRIVRSAVPGRIVKTELDDEDGIPIYEFYVLQPGGRRREVKVDARTGHILEIDED